MEILVFVVYSKQYGCHVTSGQEPKIHGVFYTSAEAEYLCREYWKDNHSNSTYYWVEKKPLSL
jgi:hypothetical protein